MEQLSVRERNSLANAPLVAPIKRRAEWVHCHRNWGNAAYPTSQFCKEICRLLCGGNDDSRAASIKSRRRLSLSKFPQFWCLAPLKKLREVGLEDIFAHESNAVYLFRRRKFEESRREHLS